MASFFEKSKCFNMKVKLRIETKCDMISEQGEKERGCHMKSKFHEYLTLLRKMKYFTQAQMADRLGISRSTYANYETGNRSPDLETLEKIREVLDVPMDALFGRYPDRMPEVIRETTPYHVEQQRSQELKTLYYTEWEGKQKAELLTKGTFRPPVKKYHKHKDGRKRLAIGNDNFRKLREKGSYYTDKTRLIEEFLDSEVEVTLVTRPRRFGKTLNMSMLAEFLDCSKDSREIFEGLQIMESEYAEEMNCYPVLFFTFHNVKGTSAEILLQNLCYALVGEYERYKPIWQDERVSLHLRRDMEQTYQVLGDRRATLSEVSACIMQAIAKLSEALEQYYGKGVYILIDEYDTPFIEAHVNGYYEQVHSVLALLLGSALKGNPALEKAMLIGIQRMAKENIFSGLNNLSVCTVKDPEYADCFGFTEEETKELLAYYGLELSDKIRAMYDGYLFGGMEVYNPWSVIYYAYRKRLEPYWVNTSENRMIREAMDECGSGFYQDYEKLITEGAVVVAAQIETSFYEYKTRDALWGLLINAGMVTIEDTVGVNFYKLQIPNQEVKYAFQGLTAHYLNVREGTISQLLYNLCRKNWEEFEEQYQRILLELPSYYDLKDENSYHMMMLGMCAFLFFDYEVKSNRESGKGRSDIILKSRNGKYPNIILEFKYTKEESQNLEALADEAILQIRKMKYDVGMQGEVFYLGLAHCGKNVAVTWAEK